MLKLLHIISKRHNNHKTNITLYIILYYIIIHYIILLNWIQIRTNKTNIIQTRTNKTNIIPTNTKHDTHLGRPVVDTNDLVLLVSLQRRHGDEARLLLGFVPHGFQKPLPVGIVSSDLMVSLLLHSGSDHDPIDFLVETFVHLKRRQGHKYDAHEPNG